MNITSTHTQAHRRYVLGQLWPFGNELHLKPNEKPLSHRLVENEQLQDRGLQPPRLTVLIIKQAYIPRGLIFPHRYFNILMLA